MDDRDPRILWCGNLSERATNEIVRELFFQAGPVDTVSIPRDKDGRQRNYAFVTYVHPESVPYALELFRGTRLYDKTLNLQCRTNSKNGRAPAPMGNYQMGYLPDHRYPEHKDFRERDVEEYSESRMGRFDTGNELSDSNFRGHWSFRGKSSHRFQPYDKGPRSNKDMDRSNRRGNDHGGHHAHQHNRNREKNKHGYRGYK